MPESPDTTQTTPRAPRRLDGATVRTLVLLLLGLAVWWLLFSNLGRFAQWYAYSVMRYEPPVQSTSAEDQEKVRKVIEGCACVSAIIPEAQVTASMKQGLAVAFILFQLPHTFMLLFLVVLLMGIVRSFFSAERTRALLAGKHPLIARLMAAGLGIVTPFCSCSAVPLFIGFATAGVPLGATFTFLVTAPLVNEIALVVLFNTFNETTALRWTVVSLYLVTGVTIALITGWLVERLQMQRYVEEWVYAIPGSAGADVQERLTFTDRVRLGFVAVKEIFGRVWLFVLIGIGVGAVLHAFVSQQWLLSVLGRQNWWSVPLAVLIGVPIYSNPAGIIPVVTALHGQGVPIGTLLALMMAVVGLSLPEFIILRKVLKLRLIALFAGIVALGILIVGYLFNLLLAGR
jgi:uncharacterized membrane protein YraQ (UPF0718 family)